MVLALRPDSACAATVRRAAAGGPAEVRADVVFVRPDAGDWTKKARGPHVGCRPYWGGRLGGRNDRAGWPGAVSSSRRNLHS